MEVLGNESSRTSASLRLLPLRYDMGRVMLRENIEVKGC